jgi:predicted CoA-binding protein
MTEAEQILRAASSILIVDWPSRDVPDTLAGAGFAVLVKGGPDPAQYAAHVDLVYVHRPIAELSGIVAMAKSLGARTVWYQSGLASSAVKDPKGCWLSEDASREARTIVEAAELRLVDDVYIADAVRRLGIRK